MKRTLIQTALSVLLLLTGLMQTFAQEVPYYTATATPASGSTIAALSTITIDLQSDTYDAPIGKMPGAPAITVKSGDQVLDNTVTPSVVNGQLVLTISPAINETMEVTVSVPAGQTNNLAMPVLTMTTEELIAEGYCTTPAMELTYTIAPAPVKYVHSINLNARTFYNDGKATEADLILDDAIISIESFWGVTWVDLVFEDEFVASTFDKAVYKSTIVKNLSTDTKYALTAFPMRDEIMRGNTLRLFLSTENYINKPSDQGRYEIIFPEGVARTKDGLPNEQVIIHFTYGNGDIEKPEFHINDYLGDYQFDTTGGETSRVKTFELLKGSDGRYYATKLYSTSLLIPVLDTEDGYFLQATSDATSSFSSIRGGNVQIRFEENKGNRYLLLDESVVTRNTARAEFSGYYRLVNPKPLPEEPEIVAGDANGDGNVDTFDVVAIADHILNGTDINVRNADTNGDGEINTYDIVEVCNIILGTK